jgi:hypothetical protein
MAKNKLDTGGMPEKIINAATFQLKMVDTLHNDIAVASKLSSAATNLITEYFEKYYDNLAKRNRYLHKHVYEFGHAGQKEYRLFKPQITAKGNASTVSYKLIDAKLPNKNGYIFTKKAQVMESGTPVTVRPKRSSMLVFDVGDTTIFTRKPVYIKNPGGRGVAGSFNKKLEEFMLSNSEQVLNSSKFFTILQKAMLDQNKSGMMKINKTKQPIDSFGKESARIIVMRLPGAKNAK